MSRRATTRLVAFLVVLTMWLDFSAFAQEIASFADHPDLSRDAAKSGIEFLNTDTQALQRDEFANPGGLWLDKGEALFKAAPVSNNPSKKHEESCAGCHSSSGAHTLIGAATRYPAYDAKARTLLNLEGRINACRTRYQHQTELPYESEALLALTAYVARLSRGLPYRVSIDGPARTFFDEGRRYFFQRKGQLNLACSQCHDDLWGKWLRGERISQGQPTAFPGYRLEWQTFGSLHRRLQDCDAGVRAERQALGSETYRSVELYLAWRAAALPIESPGVRR